MTINEEKENFYNYNYISNPQKKLLAQYNNNNNNKNHFQKFSFPKIKKLFYNKSKVQIEDDERNENSHSNKKAMTSLNVNNEIVNLNNSFIVKKIFINKNEINKMIKSKKLKKDKLLNSAFDFRKTTNTAKTINTHAFYYSKYYFPEINSSEQNNKNYINIYSYNNRNKNNIQQSLEQNNYIHPNNISNVDIKTIRRAKSNSFDNSSNEKLKQNKCNNLFLKYKEKDIILKNNYKLMKFNSFDTNKIINAINDLLMPNDKTFEKLKTIINDRLINKESINKIDDDCFINHNYDKNKNKIKIIETIFKDIIIKIYKRMLNKGYKSNSLINLKEIKEEYNNQIKIIKYYLETSKINNDKFFSNNYHSISTGRNKNKYIIKLKNNLVNKDTIKNMLNNENDKNDKIKNKSCDNFIFRYYNFNEASQDLNKQNLIKLKLNHITSIPFDKALIEKIKLKNSFIKRCVEIKNNKNKINKNIENEFNRMLNYSECISKNNNLTTNVRCLLNNRASINEEKGQFGFYPINNKRKLRISKTSRVKSAFNLHNKMKQSISNNELINNNKKKTNNSVNNIFKKNNNNNLKDINNRRSINKIEYKSNKKEILQDNINPKNRQQFSIFSENKNKKYNLNEDIINLLKSKKESQKINEDTENSKSKRNSKINLNNFNNNNNISEENNLKNNIFKEESKADNLDIYSKNESLKEQANNELIFSQNDNSSSLNINNFNIDVNNKNNNKNIYKRTKIRHHSISFNKNILKSKEFPIFKNTNSNSNSNENFDYNHLNNELNKNNNFIRSNERHKSISHNYYQLFFKNEEQSNKKEKTKYKTKRKNPKKKSKNEITFKTFLEKAKEETKNMNKNINNKNININNKDNKESKWENKFNEFKNYIAKLKKMNREEFRKDTLKFIKKGENI